MCLTQSFVGDWEFKTKTDDLSKTFKTFKRIPHISVNTFL